MKCYIYLSIAVLDHLMVGYFSDYKPKLPLIIQLLTTQGPNSLHHSGSGVSKGYDLKIAYSYINQVWAKQVKSLIDIIKST